MIETMTGDICLNAFTLAASAVAEAMSKSKKPRRQVVDATSLDPKAHDHKNTGQPAELDLPELVPMNLVRTNGGTQARMTIDETVVKDYADALEEGAKLPPVVVYYDENVDAYWLADGFHRFEAHRAIGRIAISAFIKDGTQRDAKLHAAGANGTHGLQRTNADKRCAVMMLLEDPEWVQWSDRKIARQCGVGNKFVGDVRASIRVPNTDSPACISEHPVVPSTRTVTRKGTTYEQKVKARPGASSVSAMTKESPLAAATASAPALDTTTESATAVASPKQIVESNVGELQTVIDALGSQVGELQAENAALRVEVADLKSDRNVLRAEYDFLLGIAMAGDKAKLDEVARYKGVNVKTEKPFSKSEATDDPGTFHTERAQPHAEIGGLYTRPQDSDAQLETLTSEKEDITARLGDLAAMFQEAMTCHDEMRVILETELTPDEMPGQLRQARELARMLESRVTEAPRRHVHAICGQAGIAQATDDESAAHSKRFSELDRVEPIDCRQSDVGMPQVLADDECGAYPATAQMPEDDQ